MSKTYKNIIFDLDGTLADTAPDIINCLKQSFEKVLQMKDVKIKESIIGPPVSEMFKIIMPGLNREKVEALTKMFRACYDKSLFLDTYLYEGVKDLLQALTEQSYKIFIVTNKPALPTKKILKKLKIDFFDKVITPDIQEKKKLNKSEMLKFLISDCCLDASKSVMVGDTENDITAARENDIDSVAVLYGYSVESELLESKPKFILSSIKELLKIIK